MIGNSDTDLLDEQAAAIDRLKKEVAQCALELGEAALLISGFGHPRTGSLFAAAAARAKAASAT